MLTLSTDDLPRCTPLQAAVRAAARQNLTKHTSGLAPGYLQANLIVLSSRYAEDFRGLCQRNPVTCPLLAESEVGSATSFRSYLSVDTGNVDISTDAPLYKVNNELVKSINFTSDHMAFLIGCSFSFEEALQAAGSVHHIETGRNVPMYRTNIPLMPSGIFHGNAVVSMRPYKNIGKVRNITRPFKYAHGEPIAWGWDAAKSLGIDIDRPDFGDPPLEFEGVPVFWGCGVTPQEAVLNAGIEVISHAPGHMIVLDVLCHADGSLSSVK